MKTHRNIKKFKKHKVLRSRVVTHQLEKERIRNLAIAVIFGIVIIIFLTGRKGLIKLIQLKFEQASLKSEITGLTKDNLAMKEKIEKLQKDPKTIEKIAREELGLVKKGETIYKFVPAKKEKESP